MKWGMSELAFPIYFFEGEEWGNDERVDKMGKS